jgi:hypothetical protein
MPRNISDEEYNYLRGRTQVADFVESIYNDPNLNAEAKRLIKKKYPQLQIPDLDIRDEIDKRFAEEKKARTDEEAVKAREADEARWKKERDEVKARYNFTDEGMEKVEKMMVEKNVGDYDVAASYVAAKEPKPSEAQFDTFRWNHEKQAGWQDIAKDPEGWGRSELMKAMRIDSERERNGR